MKAFPSPHDPKTGTMQLGMELRDYFAAKAMQAVLINSDKQSTRIDQVDEWVGNYAYTVADAMMKAREA